jgi:endonuclease/exonuclease/phosphatase family metal-dependent hydrolase
VPQDRGSGVTRRQILLAGAAAGIAACRVDPSVFPVSHPDPATFDACACRSPRELSVLTWNVYMMPQWIHESPQNEPRAAAIAATLLEQDFDILCLQKVFDRAAREVLERALARRYPFRYGPANDRGPLLNSGVWVLSRRPLADYQEIEFRECADVECFARKGAVLLSGTCGPQTFRLIVTHLQGEEGPSSEMRNQWIRDRQMRAIWKWLIEPHVERAVPIVVCGDFATPRFESDMSTPTASYRRMLRTFGAKNGSEPRITLEDNRNTNQLASSDTGFRNEMDYVLVRSNGCPMEIRRQLHKFRRAGWDSEHPERADLSYRYAVSARIAMGAR